MKMRWMQIAVVMSLAFVGLVGCGGSGSSTTLPDPEVRFINGSPDTNNLDFLMNDVVKAGNVAYLGASSDFQAVEYLDASEDGYDISARRTGQVTDLDRRSNVLGQDTSGLILALGLQDPGSEPEKRLRLELFQVLRTTPTGSRSRVYFVNGFIRSAGFDTPSVTFQSVIPGDPSSIDNPQFAIRDVGYATLQTITVDAGLRTFIVRRADTDALVQYASQSFNFVGGRIYLALMTGQEANPNPALQPRIQFIELSTKD